ncbi:UDP-glucuronosyl/UDP-glucosyltransferase [Trema orientale]|uniref:UDP-glucuronosyl/UDP-glucosyltransferase n=1 Tax=Trema orientale TaxID=63057 RepID=A0A2P5G0H5_TREOI|nr:UDP-glucuronosyl/UDP-glucosyltransferase [Trema orientale]
MAEFSKKMIKTHILVIPYPAPGHLLPTMDLANQLAMRGIAITFLVTPKNLPFLQPLLSIHPCIETLVLPFPTHPSIPAGIENMQELPLTFIPDIVSALSQLHDPVLQWFLSHPCPPVAIIDDLFLSCWTNPLAHRLGIRRLGFAPFHAYTLDAWWSRIYKKCDDDINNKKAKDYMREIHVANMESWGIVLNSFSELDGEVLDHLKKNVLGHDRAWSIGPLLSFPVKTSPNISADNVMAWLDMCKEDNPVVYVGFGSQINLTGTQMEALANALDRSGVRFIWAVKEPMKGVQADDNGVVPTWFEDRTAGRGLVLRGWVPQAAILRHRAVGSYLTHCGWNSTLEGLLSGVLLLAWPMQADHYVNTKLMVNTLGVAVRVCEGLRTVPDPDELAKVLAESVCRTWPERDRAVELGKVALKSIGPGGSSHIALDALVKDLSQNNHGNEKLVQID